MRPLYKMGVILAIILCIVVAILTGMANNTFEKILDKDKQLNKFIGTWKQQTDNFIQALNTFICFSDGSLSYAGSAGIWYLQDERLILEFRDIGLKNAYSVSFTNEDTMVLTDMNGYSITYLRQ